MDKELNCIVIGNNPRHAKIFNYFCGTVYLAIDREKSIQNRLSNDINEFNCIAVNNKTRLFKYVRRIHEIRKWTKLYGVDIIFTNTKFDLICSKIACCRKKKKPLIICTFHNSLAWQNKNKVKLLSHLIDICSDGCVCLSEKVYDVLSKNIKKEKLLFQPNTIDSSGISHKTNYKFKNNHPIRIVYIATIYDNKNQLFALKVLNRLKNDFSISIDFIGEILNDDYYSMLIKFIKDNNLVNNVCFKGSIDNCYLKNNLLYTYDLYFSPSLLEMSPLNILEAKASGLPIVASHAFGQQDLLDNGFDGLLYEDGNEGDAFEKISILLKDEPTRRRIGENAYLNSTIKNNMFIASEEMESFVKRLCKER